MPDRPDASRRRLLAALALAPAACASSRASATPRASSTPVPAAPPADPYRVVREHPLSEGSEPALAFRALRSPR